MDGEGASAETGVAELQARLGEREGVPADEAPCHLTDPKVNPGVEDPYKCPGGGEKFDFRRLGLRTTAMLISPWVKKGTVFQEPQKVSDAR